MKTDFFQLLWNSLEDFTLRVLLAAAIVSIIANEIVEEDERATGIQLFISNLFKILKAWVEGFAILVAVFVCSCVTAINDLQKERQFRKLKEISGAKKEVENYLKPN